MPTLGLFFTSLLSPSDYITNGWWRIFSKPSLATFENYSNVWNTTDIPTSLRITAEIAIGGTILPIMAGALPGDAFSWVGFPGGDILFVVGVALPLLPLPVGLVPGFPLHKTRHPY